MFGEVLRERLATLRREVHGPDGLGASGLVLSSISLDVLVARLVHGAGEGNGRIRVRGGVQNGEEEALSNMQEGSHAGRNGVHQATGRETP